MDKNLNEFCKCEDSSGQYSEVRQFGSWLRCIDCGRYIEDSFKYYGAKSTEEHMDED